MMRLTCLVDNAVEPSSPFWGEHGLSFLIETKDGRVLLDTGKGILLLHNLTMGRVDPRSILAVALSHGHNDHTGGLAAFLKHRGSLPVYYAHSDLLRPRFSWRGGEFKAIGLSMEAQDLESRADLRSSPGPQEILPGVWTTGQIINRPEPEGRSVGHLLREGDDLIPDPYRDDMALVLEGKAGLVLVCGCAHAGLLNTLLHVRQTFGRDPVIIAGGTHLVSAGDQELQRVIEVLQGTEPLRLYPNHCTGWKACLALAAAFGDRVSPCPAGTVLEV